MGYLWEVLRYLHFSGYFIGAAHTLSTPPVELSLAIAGEGFKVGGGAQP